MVGLLDIFPRCIPLLRRIQVWTPHVLHRCFHHARSIIGLQFLSEPGWLRARLRAAGLLGRQVILGSPFMPGNDRVDRLDDANPYFSNIGRSYIVRPSDVHVTLFQAQDNHRNIRAGWKYIARKGVTLHRVPGDHMGLFQPEHSQP